MALRSISLCAGIGGIDLGLAGVARSVVFVERECFSAAVLVKEMQAARLDKAPIWSDLRTFDAKAWRGADLVTGGYPCQPFSCAGNRQGADDERHLWPEVLRVLVECEAPLAFLENVRGHVTLGLPDVLADLARVGFHVEWGCLSAADACGAPHRRDRLWILAHRPGYLADARRRGEDWLQQPVGHRGWGEATGHPTATDACHAGQDVADPDSGGQQVVGEQDGGGGSHAGVEGSRGPVADGRSREGSNVEHASSERRGEGGAQQQGRVGVSPPDQPGQPVGDAQRSRPQGHGGERGLGEGRQEGEAGGPGGAGVPDPEGVLRASVEWIEQDRARREFPPGPGDDWSGVPDDLKPSIRRVVAGIPNRVDRLRSLGNAVVPACARAAFMTLVDRAASRTPPTTQRSLFDGQEPMFK